MIKKLVALATMAASLSFAGGLVQPTPAPSTAKRLWWASVAALAGATVVDASSSWGRHELNPLLSGSNGTFNASSVGIKAGLVGAGVAIQWLAMRHNAKKLEKPLGFANFAAAGLTAGAAIHNLR